MAGEAVLVKHRQVWAARAVFYAHRRAGTNGPTEVVARQPFYENFTKFLQWLEKSDIADELTLVHAKDQCSPQRD